MIRSIGTGFLGVFLALMSGLVNVGDRTLNAATAIVSNEFFMMIVTIVGFVVLLKM